MDVRLNYAKAAPGYGAMAALQTHVYDCGLEPLLLELVKRSDLLVSSKSTSSAGAHKSHRRHHIGCTYIAHGTAGRSIV